MMTNVLFVGSPGLATTLNAPAKVTVPAFPARTATWEYCEPTFVPLMLIFKVPPAATT